MKVKRLSPFQIAVVAAASVFFVAALITALTFKGPSMVTRLQAIEVGSCPLAILVGIVVFLWANMQQKRK
jgi:hypothetical protein